MPVSMANSVTAVSVLGDVLACGMISTVLIAQMRLA
jgi:hypothetical protein